MRGWSGFASFSFSASAPGSVSRCYVRCRRQGRRHERDVRIISSSIRIRWASLPNGTPAPYSTKAHSQSMQGDTAHPRLLARAPPRSPSTHLTQNPTSTARARAGVDLRRGRASHPRRNAAVANQGCAPPNFPLPSAWWRRRYTGPHNTIDVEHGANGADASMPAPPTRKPRGTCASITALRINLGLPRHVPLTRHRELFAAACPSAESQTTAEQTPLSLASRTQQIPPTTHKPVRRDWQRNSRTLVYHTMPRKPTVKGKSLVLCL